MAATTIADILNDTKRFAAWVQMEHVRLSKLRQAGLIATNDVIQARADAAGNVTAIPFLDPLDGVSVRGTDSDADVITADGITGDEIQITRMFRNKAWAGARLASLVSGADVMGSIAGGVAGWRAREEERILVSMLAAVYDNAVANDATDLVTGAGTTNMDAAMLIDAGQTKGERKDMLNTLVVHSAIHAQLQKDNLITVVAPSDQNVGFEAYLGKRLVVSDSMPVNAGVYTSVLCANGVFAVADGNPPKGAIAYVNDEKAGNGSGVETLIARRSFIAGVTGYSFGIGNPTDAQLADDANYARKVDAKLLPFTFIRSNIG